MQQTVSCRFAYSPLGGDKEKTLQKYLLTSSRWDVCWSKLCMRVDVVLTDYSTNTLSCQYNNLCYLLTGKYSKPFNPNKLIHVTLKKKYIYLCICMHGCLSVTLHISSIHTMVLHYKWSQCPKRHQKRLLFCDGYLYRKWWTWVVSYKHSVFIT